MISKRKISAIVVFLLMSFLMFTFAQTRTDAEFLDDKKTDKKDDVVEILPDADADEEVLDVIQPGLNLVQPAPVLVPEEKEEVTKYKVIFVGFDGEVLHEQMVEENKGAIAPTAPNVEGHEFVGWDQDFSKVTSAMEVKAKYEKKVYTITYKVKGQKDIVRRYEYEAEINKVRNPRRTGHTFIGWNKPIPEIMGSENIVVRARFKVNTYTITYKVKGQKPIVHKYKYGRKIIQIANPTKKGHTFVEWDRTIPEKMGARNIVVNAIFKANTYTITYKVDGRRDVVHKYKYGQTVVPYEPVKRGHTFDGWDRSIPTRMIDRNIVRRAKFTPNTYKVTYKVKGQEDVVHEYKYGEEITPYLTVEREGHTFDGWNRPLPQRMGDRDIVRYAKFSVNTYKVTYKVEGQEDLVHEYKYGEEITPYLTVYRPGYTFLGWIEELPANMPANNIVVTADFERTEIDYMIKFFYEDLNGEYYEVETEREMHINFVGEVVAYGGVAPEGFEIDMDKSNLTGELVENTKLRLNVYFARNTYFIRYVSDNAPHAQVDYKFGSVIEDLDPLIKVGYRFDGWTGLPEDMTMPARNLEAVSQFTKEVGIEVEGLKPKYSFREQINRADLTVTLRYEDNTTRILDETEYDIIGFNSYRYAPHERTMTVQYGEHKFIQKYYVALFG